MNAFASSFNNPLASGLPSGSSNAAFGTPLYPNLVTTPQNMLSNTQSLISGSTGTANVRGGMSGLGGGLGGAGGLSGQTSPNYGALALLPASPRFGGGGVASGFGGGGAIAALPPQLQTDLQGLLARADGISAATRTGLTMGYDGSGTLVLRGTAASPDDARRVETILKFAPRVYGLRNEMTVKTP